MIFPRKGIHTWEMIDSLIRFHALKLFARDRSVLPTDIPILIIASCQLHPVDFLAYISNNHVFRLCSIHNELFLKLIFPLLFCICVIQVVTYKLIH